MRPELVSAAGTNLERGLLEAIGAFPDGTNAHRAILLISDGESLDGAPDRAANDARRLGIPILTVVAGTAEGATLLAANGQVLTDESGRPVISRVSSEALLGISEMTIGDSVWVNDIEVVGIITESLLRHVERREVAGYRLVPVDRSPLFIAAALIAIAASLAVGILRWQDMF